MAGPIDYMAMMPQVDLGAQLKSGFSAGAAIRDRIDSRALQDEAKQLKEQYAIDLQAAMKNPTAENFAALTAKYPKQREAFKQSWDMLDQSARDSEFSAGVQAYSAIANGDIESAKAIADQYIAATENSGGDASGLKSIRSAIDANPQAVQGHLGLMLSSIDPEKWGKVATEFRASQKAPAELTEAQAKAQKAAVDAKFAESAAVMDLQKKGWDITKIQSDIYLGRQNTKIAAMNAALSKETNQLKRDELQQKLDLAQQTRDEAIRTKAADVESARGQMDNMLNTADRILNTSMDVVGSAAGPISSKMPTLSQETADFEELVTTLGSQSFLAQIPNIKGMGALSNAEGEKLQSALQNLSLRQSPERLMENIREAQRLILKGRQNIARRYGVPDVVPDRPAVATTPEVPQGDVPLPSTTGFKVLGRE